MKDMGIVMVIACVFFAITCLVSITVMQDRVFQQAARARFNPDTGHFEWLDKRAIN